MPCRHRPRLVLTVSVEGSKHQFGRLPGSHVHDDFIAFMPHHQLASLAGGGERYDQGGNHPVGLFRVPVNREETARFIDQQFVEFGVQQFTRATQPVSGLRKRPVETVFPGVSPQVNLLCLDLPAIPDRGINQRLLALAVGRARCCLYQLSYLRGRHGKREHADRLHLQAGHRQETPAMRIILSGTVD